MKKIIIISIAILIIGGTFIGFILQKQSKNKSDSATAVTSDIMDKSQVTVYYFHSTFRCHTCNKMENFTKAAIAEDFKNNKNINFLSINVDESENRHFLTDYNLYTKSVVLVDKNGRWENLSRIWELNGDEIAFKAYITAEINEFIDDIK